jgi:hypothetical protein
MRVDDDDKPIDYSRARTTALRHLAASGDARAIEELGRRGIPSGDVVDLPALEYLSLRALVLRWSDGATDEERSRSFGLAQRAHAELELRYDVDRELDSPRHRPRKPPARPWMTPRGPRYIDWERPRSSKCYPDPRLEPPTPETVEAWRHAIPSGRRAGETG